MRLNQLGQLAEKYWLEIPNHFPFVELGNFVIMPNHTHGILIIDKNNDDANVETLHCNVSTPNTAITNMKMSIISPKSGTISSIIRSYKSVVTKHARLIQSDFAWQPRFHDHIIRNAESFVNIQNYIANNPLNWNNDNFNNNG